jgi:hypothetical protein
METNTYRKDYAVLYYTSIACQYGINTPRGDTSQPAHFLFQLQNFPTGPGVIRQSAVHTRNICVASWACSMLVDGDIK